MNADEVAIVVHAYREPVEKDQRRFAREVAAEKGRKLGKFLRAEQGEPIAPGSHTVTFYYATRSA